MTSPENPILAARAAQQKRSISADEAMLQDHCTMLNRFNWVRASGKPYRVIQRKNDDGSFTLMIERE